MPEYNDYLNNQEYVDSTEKSVQQTSESKSPNGFDTFLSISGDMGNTLHKWTNDVGLFFGNLFSSDKTSYDEKLASNVTAIQTENGTEYKVRIYEDCKDFFLHNPIYGNMNSLGVQMHGADESMLSNEDRAIWENYKNVIQEVSSAEYDENGKLIMQNDDIFYGNNDSAIFGEDVPYIMLDENYVPVDSEEYDKADYNVDAPRFETRVNELMNKFGFTEDIAKHQATLELSGNYTAEEVVEKMQEYLETKSPAESFRSDLEAYWAQNGVELPSQEEIKEQAVSAFQENMSTADDPPSSGTPGLEQQSSSGGAESNMENADISLDDGQESGDSTPKNIPANAVAEAGRDVATEVMAEDEKFKTAIADYIAGRETLEDSLGPGYDTERFIHTVMRGLADEKMLDSVTVNAYTDLVASVAESMDNGISEMIEVFETLPEDVKETASVIYDNYRDRIEKEIPDEIEPATVGLDGIEVDVHNDITTEDIELPQLQNDIEESIGVEILDGQDTEVYIPDVTLPEPENDTETVDSSNNLSFDDMLGNHADTSLTDSATDIDIDISGF